jgi:hypothetical protein
MLAVTVNKSWTANLKSSYSKQTCNIKYSKKKIPPRHKLPYNIAQQFGEASWQETKANKQTYYTAKPKSRERNKNAGAAAIVWVRYYYMSSKALPHNIV